ncbi:hypothetical protein CGZ60_04180 [Neisseria animalis]|nr:hypothetical protein CGZ60_04180 [Neisseria animalis]
MILPILSEGCFFRRFFCRTRPNGLSVNLHFQYNHLKINKISLRKILHDCRQSVKIRFFSFTDCLQTALCRLQTAKKGIV